MLVFKTVCKSFHDVTYAYITLLLNINTVLTAGFERSYTVGEDIGTLEVCIAILDSQNSQIQLLGNVHINFTVSLETATGTLGKYWLCMHAGCTWTQHYVVCCG